MPNFAAHLVVLDVYPNAASNVREGKRFKPKSKAKVKQRTLVYLQCFVEQNWFHLIGIICGLAIYNSTVVDLHFPLALYKKLLDVSPSLEDFKELSPTEARWNKL